MSLQPSGAKSSRASLTRLPTRLRKFNLTLAHLEVCIHRDFERG